jgi:hypothetical protein
MVDELSGRLLSRTSELLSILGTTTLKAAGMLE